MIFYLTYNDLPGGIYSSQVLDVIDYLRTELKQNIRLIAFISIRSYFKNRSKIKQGQPNGIVLPMFPGIHNWRRNSWVFKLFCFLYSPQLIIARSIPATNLALKTRIKTVYDGRGAIAAEWKEYGVVKNQSLTSQVDALEKEAVMNSNFRISVSNKLVEYWNNKYNYKSNDHVVIPCTLNKLFLKIKVDAQTIEAARKKIGLKDEDIVFVYSGSLSGWQSFELLENFICKQLSGSQSHKFLYLGQPTPIISKISQDFPGQVFSYDLKSEDVPQYLITADYGLLIREQSLTNQVASPVKFAEYLASGLKILISDGLGDFSEYVTNKNLGFKAEGLISIKPGLSEKIRINSVAMEDFSKSSFILNYKKIIDNTISV